jgi:hypothetical protein
MSAKGAPHEDTVDVMVAEAFRFMGLPGRAGLGDRVRHREFEPVVRHGQSRAIKRGRRLAIVFVLIMSTLAFAGSLLPARSHAAVVNGNPLTILADGVGDMQVRLAGSAVGELEPASASLTGAGLCLLLNLRVPVGSCGNQLSITNVTGGRTVHRHRPGPGRRGSRLRRLRLRCVPV